MVPKLKAFIEEHIDLIEQKRWHALYSYATAEIPYQVGNLTYNLIQAGVNPLLDLRYVFAGMFRDAMDLLEVDIPDNITSISKQAFINCYYLKRITIPTSVRYIDDTAFSGCYDLEDIQYEGTTTDFLNNIKPTAKMFEDVRNGIVECSDARLLFEFDGTVKVLEG